MVILHTPLTNCLTATIICFSHIAHGLISVPNPMVHNRWSVGVPIVTRKLSYYGKHYEKSKPPILGMQNEGGDNDADGNNKSSDEGLPSIQQAVTPIMQSKQSINNENNNQSLTQAMALMGTSPRRVFLSMASSTSIAFAANFFGITSNVLSALPEEFSEKSGLDTFYPRGDYKRAVVRSSNNAGIPTSNGKCSFLIPKEWVADTSLALAQAQRQARTLDYSMGGGGNTEQQKNNVLPDAAYGPPGNLDSQGLSNGDTNVSVIINNGMRNFSLASSLGSDPTSAAEVLLSSRFAPRRGVPKLVSAIEDRRGESGVPVYQFEYTVDRGERAKPLRAISVVAGSAEGDAFVTLTVVSKDEEWQKPIANERLRRVAESFKLV